MQSVSLGAGLPLAGFRFPLPGHTPITDDDALLCGKKFELAVSLALREKPIDEVIVAIGKSFLGTEYVANALEIPGAERLVVNLRGLDCVTFYENSLVLARCVKKNSMTFEDYKKELQLIRYRGGVIDGYTSRLHYTSDYFYDNEKRGVWKNITKEIGGVPYTKKVNFMSTHPDSYRQLKEHPEFLGVIRQQEETINKRETYFIPKGDVARVSEKIQSGDIVGITTDIEGLDCSHTGIALRKDGELHFMHAPNVGYKVTITEKTFAEYLAGNKKQSGVMIVRSLEPLSKG